ncbi:MAG: hypothetical protein M3096_07635 [Actinomycetia bacterium]|nr:hypothetical protein [Actinomycetes bacterium]
MRRHTRGMGRGRMNSDRFEDYDESHRRGGMGFGLGHHGSHAHGRRFNRPSTAERIEYLEEFQRDLEEMTEDVASQLAWLRQRATEQATP